MVATVRDGRLQRAEMFEPGTRRPRWRASRSCAARTRPAGRPPRPPRELIARYVAASNARDWDALRAIYAPGLRFVDRRLVGWGELEGPDAVVEAHSGIFALAADMQIESELLAAGSLRLG